MKPHKWAKELHAKADGECVQRHHVDWPADEWQDRDLGCWDDPDYVFRIKPKPVFEPKEGDLVLVKGSWKDDEGFTRVFDHMHYEQYQDKDGMKWRFCEPHSLQAERDELKKKCEKYENRLEQVRKKYNLPLLWQDWFDKDGNAK